MGQAADPARDAVPRKVNRRSERIAIYLLPGPEVDRTVLTACKAIKAVEERNQDILRRALYHGLLALHERGEIPDDVLRQREYPSAGTLGEILAAQARRRGLPRAFAPPGPALAAALPDAAAAPVVPSPPRPEPPREERPPPPPPPPAEEEEPDFDALMGMMGGSQPAVREDA